MPYIHEGPGRQNAKKGSLHMKPSFFDPFWEKYFGFSFLDIYFCPFLKTQNTFLKKPKVCDHILTLCSGHRKNNAKFVTIIFFSKYLKTFSFVNIWKLLETKICPKTARNFFVIFVTMERLKKVVLTTIY